MEHNATVASARASVSSPAGEQGPAGAPAKRRRRTPDEARAEILDAARALLDEQGPQGLNVADVMKRTTLSRKAFYVHFDGRTALLLGLLQPLRGAADDALHAWDTGTAEAPGTVDASDTAAGAPPDATSGRAALDAAARMYREHGAALRAVFWSSGDDPEVMAVRAQLVEPILAAARRAVAAAPAPPVEPEDTATALATMNVHTLLERAPGASDAELRRLTDALAEVWERTLGVAPPPGSGD